MKEGAIRLRKAENGFIIVYVPKYSSSSRIEEHIAHSTSEVRACVSQLLDEILTGEPISESVSDPAAEVNDV